MRNTTLKIIAFLILATMSSISKAQFANGDTINICHIKVSSSSHGITMLNNLDTYMSGYDYHGVGYNYNHENFRDAIHGKYKWKYQTLFNSIIGFTELYDSKQYTLMLNHSWSGYHIFKKNKQLQLLGGIQIQFAGGALYIPTNGNNPISLKLRTSLAATGMAIYHIPTQKKDMTIRYQLDIPFIGVAFFPSFGQSYYEIFGLGNYNDTFHLTHPLNSPSFRHTFSFDVTIGKKQNTTLRISYIGDIHQSEINEIRTHMYNNSFLLGIVKTLYKINKKSPLKPYSPF